MIKVGIWVCLGRKGGPRTSPCLSAKSIWMGKVKSQGRSELSEDLRSELRQVATSWTSLGVQW